MQQNTFAVIIWGDTMKKAILIILVIFVLLSLTACPSPFIINNYPANQSNTYWESEDKTIEFYVGDESYPVYGTIITDKGEEDIIVCMSIQSNSFYIKRVDDENSDNDKWYIEHGYIKKIRKNHFVAVVKISDYYESGTELVFHKKGN